MRPWMNRSALLPTAVLAILLLVLIAAEPNRLRTILVIPLVLFLPGFALTHILFERERLGFPERLLLSLGLSVALTALIGLILNWTPWGITPVALWTALFLGLAVEAAVILFVRRLKWTDIFSRRGSPSFTARQWVLMGLAALVTITALYVALAPTNQQGFEGYTTLWIQPAEGPDTLRLGVSSDEFETTKYQLQFEFNGTVREGPTLELKPGESWQSVLQIPSDQWAGNPLRVFLYRVDQPNEVYRHVVWWPE